MDDVVSNNSQKRTTSKPKNADNQAILYSLKKGNTLNLGSRQSTQSNIKKKLMHKSKNQMNSMG